MSSDFFVTYVPDRSGYAEAAEVVEGRGLAKGNLEGCNRDRTQCRDTLQQALDRVRQAARRVRLLLTALWHHVYHIDGLREAYYSVNRRAASGVDGETWAAYGGT
jgi:RNA-directed DNA polymerase